MKNKHFITIIFFFALLIGSQTIHAQCSVTASATNTGVINGLNKGYCPGSLIELSAGGAGSVPVSYQWAGPLSFAGNIANPTIPNASPSNPTNHNGIYTVTVTFSNGCTASSTTRVTVNDQPNANASSTGTRCENSLLLLSASGGGSGETFVWQGPNSFMSSLQNPTIANVTSSASGAYSVTITNSSGCTAIAVTSINIYSPPVVSISQTGGSCAGNNLSLVADPPNATAYQWSGPNSFAPLTQTATLNAISANNNGNYTVVVTDSRGCSASTSTIVSVTTVVPSAVTNSPVCAGGTLALIADGGTIASWTGPNSFASGLLSATIPNVLPVASGTYTVIVTNASGCSASTTVVAQVNALPTVSAVKTDATCYVANNGTATATALSGVAPYTFQWSNGPSDAIIGSLAPDIYTVTLTDANTCSATASVTISQPLPLTVQVTQIVNALCSNRADGGASATVSGGTGTYTYLWSNTTGVNPVNNLPCGANWVLVTDQNNCTNTQNFNILCPSVLQTTDTIAEDVKCFGGTTGVVRIRMTGGTQPYTYNWFTLTPTSIDSVANVGAGTYSVSVSDANNCPFGPVTITVRQPQTPVSLTINGTAAICKNGSTGTATVIPAGGTPGYRYAWDSFATGSIGATAVNLPVGVYNVTVSDQNACSAIAQYTITEPDSVHVTAKAINTICYNDDNGFVLVNTISGGNGGPYTYSLDNANFQADTIFAGLVAGLYTIYAQDTRGCLDTAQVRVFQPSPIQITIANGSKVTIPMGEGVRLVTNVNVAPSSLNYVWTPRVALSCENMIPCTNPFVQPLDPIRYTVLVTDTNTGCTATTSVLVEVEKNRNIYVPNIITPNNDGYNDFFMVYGGLGAVKINTLKIFDRWGEMVFEAKDFLPNDQRYSWDGWFKGEIMHPAVFVYYMEVEFVDGQKIPYKGDITVVR